ncbi:unnamed protein product [Meganyctiphanes norvegica]|uniref:Lipocalin/cytosolic fatty-acid binding domain-containing protein n=1 Tax=Meganyctiphanes norvegica TaxID=48144 RepID=A0AAV2QHL3_MEGNR
MVFLWHCCLPFLLLVPSSHSQVFFRGPCLKLPVIKDFDWHRYLGKWHDVMRYPVFYQEVGRCWTGTYIKNKKTGQISVRLDFQDILLNKPLDITVAVHREKPYSEPNRFSYTIPGVPLFEDHYEALTTDYDNWTVEYTCVNKGLFGHTKIAWILTRSPKPSYHVIEAAKHAMRQRGVDPKYLEKTDQSCNIRGNYGYRTSS